MPYGYRGPHEGNYRGYSDEQRSYDDDLLGYFPDHKQEDNTLEEKNEEFSLKWIIALFVLLLLIMVGLIAFLAMLT